MKVKIGVPALVLLLVSGVQSLASSLPDSCGDDKTRFEVKTQKGHPAPPAPQPGKAQVLLIQTENHMITPFRDATIRWGMDGAWVGADNGNSYFVLSVDPGVHHLCANWQSVFRVLKKNVDLTSFTAEAGRAYYFQADVNVESKESVSFALSPLNEDKGKYLVETFAQSTSRPK